MREIKFRVWDNVDYMSTPFMLEEMIWNGIEFTSDCPVMQYTGLRENNGQGEELYEGDLIINTSRNNNQPHAIKWSEKRGAWVGDYGIEYLIAEELIEITLIGNIYQNPELLNPTP